MQQFSLHGTRGRACLCVMVVGVAAMAACGTKSEPDEDFEQGGQGGAEDSPGQGGEGEEPSVPSTGGRSPGSAGGEGGGLIGNDGAAGGDAGAGSGGMAAGGVGGLPTGAGGTPMVGGCATNPVCDDFESYPTGSFTARNGWGLAASSAPMVVDETRARSGKKSIKITVPPGGEGSGKSALLSRSDRSVLSTGKSVFARMMVYLDNMPSGSGLHWAFLRASGFHAQGSAMGLLTHSLGGQPNRLRNLMLWPTSAGLQDCFNDSQTQIPTKKWTCVEWHLDPESQAMEVWFDGQKQNDNSWTTRPPRGACAADQTGGKWIIPKLSVMHFGWIHYHSFNGVTMWLDDIAIDTKRVGCPN